MYFLLEKREFQDCWNRKKSESQHPRNEKQNTLRTSWTSWSIISKKNIQINSRINFFNIRPKGKKNIKLSIPEHWCICRVGSWSTSPALQGWPLGENCPSSWEVFSRDFSRHDFMYFDMLDESHHFQDQKFAIEMWNASFLEMVDDSSQKQWKKSHDISTTDFYPPWEATNHGLPETSEPRRKPQSRRFLEILGHRKKEIKTQIESVIIKRKFWSHFGQQKYVKIHTVLSSPLRPGCSMFDIHWYSKIQQKRAKRPFVAFVMFWYIYGLYMFFFLCVSVCCDGLRHLQTPRHLRFFQTGHG